MANPSQLVKSTLQAWEDGQLLNQVQLANDVNRIYQTGSMLGRRSDGFVIDCDDSASLQFVGLMFGIHQKVDTTDVGVKNQVRCWQGPFFGMPLQTGSANQTFNATVTGAGAIGKLAYAYDSGTVTLDPSGLTYANVVGQVVGVITTNPETFAGTSVLIAPVAPRSGGARFLAATGNQTITAFDLGKTVFVPNTANLSLTLPNLTLACPGDWLKVIKTTSGANTTVTLDGNASEDINGSATNANMTTQFDTIKLIAFNTTRWIIGDKIYT